MRMRNIPAVIAFIFLAAATAPCPALADESLGVGSAFEDLKLYVTAPLRWDEDDWLALGAGLVLVDVSHHIDARVREHFATGADAKLNGGQDKNSLRDALPSLALIGGTWAYAGVLGDSDGYRETWSLIEAGALATASGEVLTYAAGRERPDATTSPNEWRKGGDSFPSVHASAAFAIGTVFAESGNDEYRWLRRIIGYGVAGGTAYIRLHENVHWLSDTVAGSVVGIATARFVLNRQDTPSRTTLQFEPTKNGWLLAFSTPFE